MGNICHVAFATKLLYVESDVDRRVFIMEEPVAYVAALFFDTPTLIFSKPPNTTSDQLFEMEEHTPPAQYLRNRRNK